jgi:hydantoinase/carbamoylase family amidase
LQINHIIIFIITIYEMLGKQVNEVDLLRLINTLNEINEFGSSDKGLMRLAYSEQERKAVEYFTHLCLKEGLQVRMDSCGNLIARREGRNPNLPAVACGSHLDTVIQGGKYDGAIGVVAALEVVRSLNDKGIVTEHPIEIICFACEESSRFGVSTIGSKAMVGDLKKESVAELKDKNGISMSEAFTHCSLDFEDLKNCSRQKGELKAFLELHIEQGPVLEAENKQIGVVYSIAAPTRLLVHVQGKGSHTGTTPMNLRKDAFLGAAEIALDLEFAAQSESLNGTVATVGECDVKPGAMNVVPDSAQMKIDIRGTSAESKSVVLQKLMDSFERLKQKRGLKITWSLLSDEQPIQLDTEVIHSLSSTCDKLGISYIQMPSGAGHDAMNMAKICPTGMIFVPSRDGLSHHPDEYTSMEQIGVGAALLEEEMMKWAGAFLTETANIQSPSGRIS